MQVEQAHQKNTRKLKKKKIILSPFNCFSFRFLIKRKHATASHLFSHLKHPSSLFSHSSLRSIPFSALPCSFKSRRLGFQHEDLYAEDENLASQSLRRKLSSQSSSDQTSWWTSQNVWQVSPSLALIPSVRLRPSPNIYNYCDRGLDPALLESKS